MNLFKSFEESKEELSKVIFPLKEQVKSAFISVFVVVTVITLFLSLVDMTMSFTVSSIIE
jgi:preprotein translocase subunit SecE